MKLTTYDVLSTGPSCGIIQMVRDATTMDSLKKNIHERHKNIKSMKDFFQYYCPIYNKLVLWQRSA